MNTANLQLEGVCAAVAALMAALREKGLLSEEEIETALGRAEDTIGADPGRPREVSAANVDAIRFPLRLLRAANRASASGSDACFSELATQVGRAKRAG